MRMISFLGAAATLSVLAACSSDTSNVGANPGDGAGGAAASAGQNQGGQGGSAEGGAGQNQGGAGQSQGGAGQNQSGGGQNQGGAGSPQGGGGQAGFNVVGSSKPRADGSGVPAASLTSVTEGNNAFAFDLYGQLQKDPVNSGKNLFFSPFSLSVALGMTTAGAKGTTLSELAKVMHFTLPQSTLHPALNSLSLALGQYPQQAKDFAKQSANSLGEPQVRLNLINTMWGEQSFTWLSPFLDVLAEDYGAAVNQADFKNNWEAERATINQWVAGQTEQRIPEILPSGSLDTLTRFVLVNAIDLTFPWAEPFDPQRTKPSAFTPEGGKAEQVPTMGSTIGTSYAEDDLAQYASLDLYDRTLTLDIYLPKAGKLADFEAALGAEVTSLHKGAEYATLDLSLPKFQYAAPKPVDLVASFTQLGAVVPFDPDQADFKGMSTDEPLHITHIYHRATLGLDEGGVQAAAASAVVGAAGGGGGPVLTPFRVDRSFFVALRDKETGTILFFGRILDPAQG